MCRVLFLILVLMCSTAFPQTRDNKPQASNVDEFGRVANGELKARLDGFFVELINNPTAQGHIITYGPNREVASRERLIRNQIYFRRFDSQRITFVTGGFSKEIKTEFWIVPAGAEPPNVLKDEKSDLPKATKFEEFGYVSNSNIRNFMDMFHLQLINNPAVRGYIINYGKTRVVLNREKVLRGHINLRNVDPSRITFVRGGNKKEFTTEFWIVPQGAEPPTP